MYTVQAALEKQVAVVMPLQNVRYQLPSSFTKPAKSIASGLGETRKNLIPFVSSNNNNLI
jgi:hypothetical protein